jgi:hypothetical protein
MSIVTLSFNLSTIPVIYQSTFLERVCQLNLDYQSLTASLPVAPPAESLPKPNFVAVDGDESAPVPATKKERKSSWTNLTEEQRKERLAKLAAGREAKKARKMSEDSLERAAPPVAVAEAVAAPASVPVESPLEEMTLQPLRDIMRTLQGKPTGVKTTPKFPTKEAIIAEIRRLRESAADGVAPSPSDDAASETSSKKERKNPWADLTPEQKAERVAKTVAARKAKKDAATAVPDEGSA